MPILDELYSDRCVHATYTKRGIYNAILGSFPADGAMPRSKGHEVSISTNWFSITFSSLVPIRAEVRL